MRVEMKHVDSTIDAEIDRRARYSRAIKKEGSDEGAGGRGRTILFKLRYGKREYCKKLRPDRSADGDVVI